MVEQQRTQRPRPWRRIGMRQQDDALNDALIGRALLDVFHDLNSHLAILVGALQLAELDLDVAHPATPMIGAALAAAGDIGSLRSWLLSYVQQEPMLRHAVDLNQIVSDDLPMLTRLLSNRAGNSARISARLAPNLDLVFAERTPLRRLLLNLVVNARDAVAAQTRGHVIITTANRAIDGAPHVVLSVRDNGSGMSAQTRARVMRAGGHTTKGKRGTGLGMAACRRTAAAYGGSLDVKSAEGYGTVVTIALPRLDPCELAG